MSTSAPTPPNSGTPPAPAPPPPKPPTGNTGDTPPRLLAMMLEAGGRYIAAAPDAEDAQEMQAILANLKELVADVDDAADTAEDASEQRNRPTPGQVEQRDAPMLETDGRKIRGRIPYGVESRDLGGWKEVIHAGALNRADLNDLVVTVDHVGLPLGRYPTTLELEDRGDAMHWAVDPPASRQDVREAIPGGDLRADRGAWSSAATSGEATPATSTRSSHSATSRL